MTVEKTNEVEWIFKGEGWFNRKDGTVFQKFANGWKYNNSGVANAQGVWRVKELLADGTEGEWLDAKAEYKNKFLLKVTNVDTPKYFYSTAGELLTAMGGYTQISGTDYWKKNDATAYMKVDVDGNTYYLPQSGLTLYNGTDTNPFAENKIPVKYYEGNTEVSGYAKINNDTKKYYKIGQDDIQGNDTTDNPMFVDELSNVQYRHKRDAHGNEIATNEDGSVAYETISPTVNPNTDTALVNRAIEDAVRELIATYPKEETENLETTADKIAYLKSKNEAEYNRKLNEYFERDFKYLLDENVLFFNKDDFNLAKSVFDNFQLVKMTEYSYLNAQDEENRSINNLFTVGDAERSD